MFVLHNLLEESHQSQAKHYYYLVYCSGDGIKILNTFEYEYNATCICIVLECNTTEQYNYQLLSKFLIDTF